ncbi:hypothetical protein EVAR_13925_1 [Eumeta japonica]|uniref:Uncharacterized protein n=1 Tax=Eumeta variegata TaxID=151549 RepID=A0A4C1U8E3_EUMVA|nr:hypothetical protein EVAR_13925_1 [Eumeta japonica]
MPAVPGVIHQLALAVRRARACQRQRDHYRGLGKAHHPLVYFREPEYWGQCPSDMTTVYLSYPRYHVAYKHPLALPVTCGRTSDIPQLPGRTLAARFNKESCRAYKK